MYISIVGEKQNVFFECDKVIETEGFSLAFMKGEEKFVELLYSDVEKLKIYAMNDVGRTVNNWGIFPEGRPIPDGRPKKKDMRKS